jgi:hypothetical protein
VADEKDLNKVLFYVDKFGENVDGNCVRQRTDAMWATAQAAHVKKGRLRFLSSKIGLRFTTKRGKKS